MICVACGKDESFWNGFVTLRGFVCRECKKQIPDVPPGQEKAAAPPAAAAPASPPETYEALTKGAAEALVHERWPEAISLFEKALALIPNPPATPQDQARKERCEAMLKMARARQEIGKEAAPKPAAAKPAPAEGSRLPELAAPASVVAGAKERPTGLKALADLDGGRPRIRPRPFAAGDIIGRRYEIRRVLGEGGFGVVFHVRHLSTGFEYALKTVRDKHLDEPVARHLFKREAEILTDLDPHPNLVRDYFVDEVDGRVYIAMEFVSPDADGVNSLEGWLAKKPPDLKQSLAWAIQFCHGMEFANQGGLKAHLDIKPPNILVGRDRVARIADFGLAGLMIEAGLPVAGTPTHMAPEQFANPAGCDLRTDIYAFGVVLYQLASRGKLPFTVSARSANPWQEIRRLHTEAAPLPLDSPLFPVIWKCLEKDPAKRFPDFAALRQELEEKYRAATGAEPASPALEVLDAEDWEQKGMSLHVLGRAADAVDCFQKSLAENPKRASSHLLMALSLAELGRHEEALAAAEAALADDEKNSAAWSAKGAALAALGRLAEAQEAHARAVQADPLNPEAWEKQGLAFELENRTDEAMRCYEEVLKLHARSPSGWVRKGDLQAKRGEDAEALKCYETALTHNPWSLDAWTKKGDLVRRQGKAAGAMECYDHAIAIAGPTSRERFPIVVRKVALLNDGTRHDEALQLANAALAEAGADTEMMLAKAAALRGLGLEADALETALEALMGNPRHAAAWQALAVSLEKTGEPDEAAAALVKARELGAAVAAPVAVDERLPVVALERRVSALYLRRAGLFENALAVIDQSLAAAPRYAPALALKAELLTDLEKWEEALAAAATLAALGGRWTLEGAYLAGRALYRLARHDEAIEKLSALAEDPRALFFKGRAELAAGRSGDGRKSLRAFLARATARMTDWVHEAHECLAAEGGSDEADDLKVAAPLRAESWNEAAEKLIKEGRCEAALKHLDRAVEVYGPCVGEAMTGEWEGCNALSASIWSNRAQCLFLLNRMEEATVAAGRALADNSALHEAWLLRGRALRRLGKNGAALATLQHLLTITGKEAIAIEKETRSEIAELAAAGATTAEKDAVVLLCEGIEGMRNRRYEDSLIAFEQAIRLEPTWSRGHYCKAVALHYLKRPFDALSECDRAFELESTYLVSLIRRALVVNEMKQYDEALRTYDRALGIAPRSATLWSMKAMFLLRLQRFPEASACVEEALRIDPEYAYSWWTKAQAECGRRRPAEELQSLRQFLKLANDRNSRSVEREQAVARVRQLEGGGPLEAAAPAVLKPMQPEEAGLLRDMERLRQGALKMPRLPSQTEDALDALLIPPLFQAFAARNTVQAVAICITHLTKRNVAHVGGWVFMGIVYDLIQCEAAASFCYKLAYDLNPKRALDRLDMALATVRQKDPVMARELDSAEAFLQAARGGRDREAVRKLMAREERAAPPGVPGGASMQAWREKMQNRGGGVSAPAPKLPLEVRPAAAPSPPAAVPVAPPPSAGGVDGILAEAERLIANGAAAQALEILKTAVKMAPQNGRVWRIHAEALARAGRPQEALHSIVIALDKNRGDIDGWELKARLLRALKRDTEAREAEAEAAKLARKK